MYASYTVNLYLPLKPISLNGNYEILLAIMQELGHDDIASDMCGTPEYCKRIVKRQYDIHEF